MKTPAIFRSVAAAALLTGLLSACNTGTNSGDTNVERGEEKSPDPADNRPNNNPNADSATSGLNRDPNPAPTGREVYEGGADRKDHNNDGIAD